MTELKPLDESSIYKIAHIITETKEGQFGAYTPKALELAKEIVKRFGRPQSLTEKVKWPEKKEYKYFKQRHLRTSERRGRKTHYGYCIIIGEKKIEVSKEDYDANIEQSKKDSIDAFMSRLSKKEYFSYDIPDKEKIDLYNEAIEACKQSLNQASQEDMEAEIYKLMISINSSRTYPVEEYVTRNLKNYDLVMLERAKAILKEYVLVRKSEPERCKHGVHGKDCFRCYPIKDK